MILNERLGVPDGIIEEASKLHKKILKSLDIFLLSNKKIPKLSNGDPKYIHIASYNLKINELYLRSFPFKLKLIYNENIETPIYISAQITNKQNFIFKDDMISSYEDIECSLSLTIKVNNDHTKSDIVNLIKEELKTKTIAHEIMHVFDHLKRNKRSIRKSSEYKSYIKKDVDFPKLIDSFLFLLYYTHNNENIVRPSEFYQQMIQNNITKSEFSKFIEDNDIIKMLTIAEKFSLDDFKENLNKDEEVINYVDSEIKKGYESIGSYADDILNLFMIELINDNKKNIYNSLDSYVKKEGGFELIGYLFNNDIETDKIKELNKRKSHFYDKFTKVYKKYEGNHHKYFQDIVKRLNFIGGKIKRKLYKLYDMLEDEESSLHKKINMRESFILNFKDFSKL